jgi:hypothetical protein
VPRVERTYTEDGVESSQWRQALARLLSTGLFHYLKEEGLLRQDTERQEEISRLLRETRKLADGEKGLDSFLDSRINGADPVQEAAP